MRERGKLVPGSRRTGHNIWTNTGREYLALLMSLQPGLATPTPFRTDSIGFMGVGTGSRLEDVSVLSLANGIEYVYGQFLAEVETPPTFPLAPTRTTVRYTRVFGENEISTGASRVDVTELGLFTNGDPAQNYVPGTRETRIGFWSVQSPVAYKTFEPVGKTNAFELEVSWEIRF
jgi:hypothetical protein